MGRKRVRKNEWEVGGHDKQTEGNRKQGISAWLEEKEEEKERQRWVIFYSLIIVSANRKSSILRINTIRVF